MIDEIGFEGFFTAITIRIFLSVLYEPFVRHWSIDSAKQEAEKTNEVK